MANKAIFIGISFPFTKGSRGIPKILTDEELIRNDLKMLLNTRKGDRVMFPDYGLDLESLVFNNTGPLLEAKIRRMLITAIQNYEPRVKINSISILDDSKNVNIEISYIINGISDALKMIIPREAASGG